MDNKKINDLYEIEQLKKRRYNLEKGRDIMIIVWGINLAGMIGATLNSDSSVYNYSFGGSVISFLTVLYFEREAKNVMIKLRK